MFNAETKQRLCARCKEWKDLTEYNINRKSKGGRGGLCRPCHKNSKTPEQKRNWDLKFRYGLSLDDFECIKAEQKNKCKICLKEPINLVVDHCHATGKVRGLLCSSCNTLLGLSGDSQELLNRAIAYLGHTRMK